MKKSFEMIVVFIFNFLGSFIFAAYFLNADSIVEKLIGCFCILNIFCFAIVFGEIYKGNVKK